MLSKRATQTGILRLSLIKLLTTKVKNTITIIKRLNVKKTKSTDNKIGQILLLL